MAQEMLTESRLRLIFEAGIDGKGEPIFKTKTFNNITKSATADQLYQAAQAIAALSADLLSGVERSDSSQIIG
ncbi:DUF1659 domain-containing protein [Bacillus methanolicus]|uniref:DUF1659 domain-containing protein n=1 Tax=Bacillus methanolicus (strain MGA3 / ATCC 53907) TaxID=796606 RepID=I3E9H9_BACMM|nr:DUF1659 domain-containing protein [Bacillus methanolicus]AIE60398.1 hypothetical protein BMMGA3_10010 [Bacillus methanolicus MGA3]EIJ83150.1 hypothetical protein MGA3_08010 [Bacillus methanolicus MGA3]UQD52416.1 DUF1659 domain-containing protein [Bacillus methanolicus]